MPGRDFVAGGGDARRVVQPPELAELAALHQRDDHAGGAGPCRPARTVQIVLVVVRRVELHDQVDVVHVDAAGRDVGGDQNAGMPGGERVQRTLPLVLVAVAVDGRGLDPGPSQLLDEPVRAVLSADEEERPPRPAGDLRCYRHLVLRRQDQDPVLGGPGIGRGRHRVQRGVGGVAGHQLADVAVQGGGEEHPLAVGRRLVDDLRDRGQETQVGHVIGLVEHGDLDAGKRAGVPLEQVDEPSRRRHHDVGVTYPGDLRADGHATVDRGDAHPDGTAQWHEDVGDLLREFPGRDEDQPAGCLLPARARRGGQPGQQRKAEGQRLARPGLGAAQHVAAGQRVGQRPGLDRERLVDVTRRERPDQPRVEAELGECGRGRRRSRGGGVQGTIKLGVRFGLRWPGGPRAAAPGLRRPEDARGRLDVCGMRETPSLFGGRMLDRRQQPRRPAGGSPAERRRRLPPYCQGYQPGWYSPVSLRMASSSAIRCEPVTP